MRAGYRPAGGLCESPPDAVLVLPRHGLTLDAAPLPPRNHIAAVRPLQPLGDYLRWRAANPEAAIAAHEAGHAVLMRAHGVPGIHASLAHDRMSGEVTHTAASVTRDDAPATVRIERLAALGLGTIFHAGIAAELLLWGGAVDGEVYLPETSDHTRAAAAFGDLFPRHPHAFCQALARHVLAAAWPQVEAIAAELQASGEWQSAEHATLGAAAGFERAQKRAWEALVYLEEG